MVAAAPGRGPLNQAQPARTDPDASNPEERDADVLRFARFSGPTGDIGQILDEIELGRHGFTPEGQPS